MEAPPRQGGILAGATPVLGASFTGVSVNWQTTRLQNETYRFEPCRSRHADRERQRVQPPVKRKSYGHAKGSTWDRHHLRKRGREDYSTSLLKKRSARIRVFESHRFRRFSVFRTLPKW